MSTLRLTTLQTLTGVEVFTAKAWVNFDGTNTVSIRGSGNVTSITDNGTGYYTVNMTNALADANYSFTGASGGLNSTSNGAVYSYDQLYTKTTTAFAIAVLNTSGSPVDTPHIMVTVHR